MRKRLPACRRSLRASRGGFGVKMRGLQSLVFGSRDRMTLRRPYRLVSFSNVAAPLWGARLCASEPDLKPDIY